MNKLLPKLLILSRLRLAVFSNISTAGPSMLVNPWPQKYAILPLF